MPKHSNFGQGFTLLELLAALAVFAVVTILAYSGLHIILTAHTRIEQEAVQLARLQIAWMRIERDIGQYVERNIRDAYGEERLSIYGTSSQLEFTRMGWRNPSQRQRSTLQRVAYHVEDHILWRSYWQVLDRAQDSQPEQVESFSPVKTLYIRFLDSTLQWHEEWPPTTVLPCHSLCNHRADNREPCYL